MYKNKVWQVIIIYIFILVYIEWGEKKLSLANYILFAYFGLVLLVIILYMIVGSRNMYRRMHRMLLSMDLYDQEKRRRVELLIESDDISRSYTNSAHSLKFLNEHHNEIYENGSRASLDQDNLEMTENIYKPYSQQTTYVRHLAYKQQD